MTDIVGATGRDERLQQRPHLLDAERPTLDSAHLPGQAQHRYRAGLDVDVRGAVLNREAQ
jgi:hypothetical protein